MNGIRKFAGRIGATVALFAVAAAFWFAQVYGAARPSVKPAAAAATEFSAERAEATLARILGPEHPHPVSSSENAGMRARIRHEFAALGIPTSVHHGFGCNTVRSFGVFTCGSVNDILADVEPGAGKAIVLLAHYDSVPAGPGAADDGSGVATVIETARALKVRGLAGQHPVLALITDGEEAGLLGAAAFLHVPELRARVGAVINVEARGNRGRSLLFQTSPGDGPLIDLYAKNVADTATSSLYAEIYRFMPNDTDLTLFIRDGFPSFNFAFAENVAHYHTSLDTRVHLDPLTLQQQGENMLGVARGLEQVDFSSLRGGNDIYVDVLGRVVLRLPAVWTLPLSIAGFLLLLAAVFAARGEPFAARAWLASFAVTPALISGAVLMGLLLHTVASLVSAMPDPAYAYPAALRLGLALGIAAVTLLVSRMAPPRAAAAAVWLWLAGLGIAAAALVPGVAPYFLLPTIIAAFLLLGTARAPGGWEGSFGQMAFFVSALPALLLWIGIAASGETLMGLKLHPLFTLPIAVGMSTLIPLFAQLALPRTAWRFGVLAAFAAAIGAAIIAGLQPSYSAIAPQRLSITYLEDRAQNRALWAVDATAPVPSAMRVFAHFTAAPEKVSQFAAASYIAPAGAPRFSPPGARVLADRMNGRTRRVSLALRGSNQTAQMYLAIPKAAMLKAIDIGDWHVDAPPQWGSLDSGVVIACMSRDCASITLTLTLGTRNPVVLEIGEQRFGLPTFGQRLAAARPDAAVPSQNGDGVLLLNEIRIPQAQ